MLNEQPDKDDEKWDEAEAQESGSMLPLLSARRRRGSLQRSRSLSVSDILAMETEALDLPPTLQKTPLSAYLLLISAVAALSSVGPILDLQVGVDPILKIFWRMTGTVVILSPMAIRSLIYDGIPHLTVAQWGTFGLAAACYATMCTAYSTSLDYTSVNNAVILSNVQALLLLAGKFLVGERVVWSEGMGALVAFCGAVLCSQDASQTTDGGMDDRSRFGDAVAICSAIGAVGYLTFGKSLHSTMPAVLFMFLIMTMGALFVLALMLLLEVNVSFDQQVDHGIFGWTNWRSDRLPLEIIMVIVCNIFGAMGYVRAFKYFDTLVISVATLMEPVAATFLAVWLSVGVMPGTKGWIGNLLVATGTLAVIYPTTQQTDSNKSCG